MYTFTLFSTVPDACILCISTPVIGGVYTGLAERMRGRVTDRDSEQEREEKEGRVKLASFVELCTTYNFPLYLFILDISIAPLQAHCYSEVLPTTARILYRSFTLKRHRQLRVKDLPKVPTWWLEQDSNRRPSGRKVSTLPKRHHAPQADIYICALTVVVANSCFLSPD